MLEQAKRRALSSSVIRELKEQYSDAPEEVREGRYAHANRQSREDEHRLVAEKGRPPSRGAWGGQELLPNVEGRGFFEEGAGELGSRPCWR